MSGVSNLPVSSMGLVDEVELAVAEMPVTVAGHENVMVETQDNDVYDEVLVEIEGGAVEPDIVSEELLPQQQGIESAKDDEVDAGGSQKPSLVSCPHCDQSGFKDNWFLGRHIQRMHHVPIKCEICQSVFVDKFWYFIHSRSCFFVCPREGCNFHDKRKARLDSHIKRHEREY